MYLKKLISLDDNELADFLVKDYRRDLILEHGSLLFEVLFSSGKLHDGPALKGLIKRMVEEGVDWYAGLGNVMMGPLGRINVGNRVPDPLRELKDLLQEKSRNQAVAKIILASLPKELKIAFCSTPDEADRLYAVSPANYLKPFISKGLLRKELESELSL